MERFVRTIGVGSAVFLILGLAAGCGVKTNDGGQGTPTPANLSISSITPTLGPINGGTAVTVNGAGFVDGTGTVLLTFDGEPAIVDSVIDNQIVATTPAGLALGAVDLSVTNLFGTQILTGGFNYEDAVFGAGAFMWAYDVINPNQFDPPVNDYIDAYAAFFAPQSEPLVSDIQSPNTCVFNPAPSNTSFVLLDAGNQVDFTNGSATVTSPRQSPPEGTVYYPSALIPGTSLFAQGSIYSVLAPGGGGLTAVDTVDTMYTPFDFSVDSPPIGQSSPAFTVQRNVDLTFSWSGGTQGYAFFIELEGFTNAGDPTNERLICRSDDVGGFTVPGGQLASFSAAGQVVVYVGRRDDTYWILPPNASLGQSVAVIYKVGVLLLN